MTSANGKIPAGSVTLNLGSIKPGSTENCTASIEKCPDKSANLNYTYSLDYLRSMGRSQSYSKQNLLSSKLEDSGSLINSNRFRIATNSPPYSNLKSAEERFSSHRRPSVGRTNSNHSSSYQVNGRSPAEHDNDDEKKSKGSVVII